MGEHAVATIHTAAVDGSEADGANLVDLPGSPPAAPSGLSTRAGRGRGPWDDMETGGATRQKARLEGGLDMKRIFWTLATIAALATTAAAAADTSSANFMLPSCKSLLARHVVENFQQGHCAGLIEGLAFLARRATPSHRSCRPDGVTTGQVVTTIVRWLKQRPRGWHENFKYLALEAMHETWPCKSTRGTGERAGTNRAAARARVSGMVYSCVGARKTNLHRRATR